MIFKAVGRLRSKGEKAFFTEQIQVYRRLVEVFCEKNGLELKAEEQEGYAAELIDMGVIEDEEGLGELKTFLGADYGRFQEAVNFVIANGSLVEDLVDKLSNAKRRLRQSAAEREWGPFAGGLLLRRRRLKSGLCAGGIPREAGQRHRGCVRPDL